MSETGRHTWRTQELEELSGAILALESRHEVERFLRDLCTIAELEAMAHRWAVAQLVDRGLPYLEVAQRTHASTTTVTRVAHWLRHGEGGYRLALDRQKAASSTG
ncbi:MAG TPA: YerC/YecD family TrpR-related protein [Gaiellaceae bacterium]|jgi:TrpR-related protein YerC/YecD|nr:YerC/YecD family TrpR-related protein [Gaiellaceae bacterium]